MAKIEVVRGANIMGSARGLKVIIDDQEAGKLKTKETRAFPVSKGKHTVYVKMDWVKSAVVELNFEEDEHVRLVASQQQWMWIAALLSPLLLLFQRFLGPGYLLEIDGKSGTS